MQPWLYGSSEAEEYEAIQDITVNTPCILDSTKDSVAIQNRYEGAVSVNTYYFVPNSLAAVKAWFEKGQYKNEIEFEVQNEGDVKIEITKAEAINDYTVIGVWSLVQIEEYAPAEKKLSSLQKGLNIVDGKKVYVK